MQAFFSYGCLARPSSLAFDKVFECKHHSSSSPHPRCRQPQPPSPPQLSRPPPWAAPTSPSWLRCRMNTTPQAEASLRMSSNLDPSSAIASADGSPQDNFTWHLQPYLPRPHTSRPRTCSTPACPLVAHFATHDDGPWSLRDPDLHMPG